MILSIQINDQTYKVEAAQPLDLAIPLAFGGAQPNAYAVERATATACEAGALVGDTRRGGSCNFEQIKFIPHCNGTHTECVGHLTNARISVHECLRDSFVGATLISVETETARESNENYAVELNETDELITRRTIEKCLKNADENFRQALIVRTLPNNESKLSRVYLDEIPPFFSTEAMRFIRELNVKHLLVDMPSIDRIFDGGKLANHRFFWNVEPNELETNERSLIENTITEMIYAPPEIADGSYLLNLQIAPFAADASPSRPRLFQVIL
ncbi:MAG: cyclase family protein [Acidobacteriota bacterium]|nr:cyclase family protein [Acidobacteriota bacterium]